jgi:hypothetical protein
MDWAHRELKFFNGWQEGISDLTGHISHELGHAVANQAGDGFKNTLRNIERQFGVDYETTRTSRESRKLTVAFGARDAFMNQYLTPYSSVDVDETTQSLSGILARVRRRDAGSFRETLVGRSGALCRSLPCWLEARMSALAAMPCPRLLRAFLRQQGPADHGYRADDAELEKPSAQEEQKNSWRNRKNLSG